jgi:heptosyltransferase-2
VSSRRAAAVVRFSSLGDVLLAAHLPSFLHGRDPDRPVHFVTKERYAGLLKGHPHLARVHALRDDEGSLKALTDALRALSPAEIFDIHGNWRSSRLLAGLPGATRRRAPKYALRRRLWVHARWLRPAPVPPLLRTYRALAGVDPGTPLTPWLRLAMSDAERSRALERLPAAVRAQGFVLLGVGARWATKRWPATHFVRLAERLERERGVRSILAVEPGEEVAPEIASYLGTRGDAALTLPFRELAAVGAQALAIVSNDSAVLHLGPALGVPAVGIFGGTVPELGFARQGPRDEAVGIALGCRPCGVHGRERCPLGHHACMRDLMPEAVFAALARVA